MTPAFGVQTGGDAHQGGIEATYKTLILEGVKPLPIAPPVGTLA